MSKQKKKGHKGLVLFMILVFIALYLLTGNLNFEFGGGVGSDTANSQETQATTQEEQNLGDVVIEIIDNDISVNGQKVSLDQLLSQLGDVDQVILRASQAKQVMYDDVKNLLNDKGIVIIEE